METAATPARSGCPCLPGGACSQNPPSLIFLCPARPRAAPRKLTLAISVGVLGLGSAAMALPQDTPTDPSFSDSPNTRRPCSEMRASNPVRQALVQEEGARKTVYVDPIGLPTVSLQAAIANGDYAAIGAELAYHHAGCSEASGLIDRSKRRIVMFTAASYPDPREGPSFA